MCIAIQHTIGHHLSQYCLAILNAVEGQLHVEKNL